MNNNIVYVCSLDIYAQTPVSIVTLHSDMTIIYNYQIQSFFFDGWISQDNKIKSIL